MNARQRAAAGLAGLVLIVAGLAAPGPPPKTSDSPASLVQLVPAHATALRLGTWAAGLGAALFIWFLPSLRQTLSRDDAASDAAVVGGSVAVVLLLTGMAMTTGLTLVRPTPTTEVTAAVIGIGNVIIDLSKFGFAALLAATCTVESRLIGPRPRLVGRALVVLLVLSALSPLASDRPTFQFGGPIDVLGTAPATLWLLWLTIQLFRSPQHQ